MTEDSHSDAGLVFILSGSLVMWQGSETEDNQEAILYTAYAVGNQIHCRSFLAYVTF